MTLYDPLAGKKRSLLISILSKLYEHDDRPLDLDQLEASITTHAARSVRAYVAALCSMGAARRPLPTGPRRVRLLWPTVLGRLWWTEQLDQAPDLFAEEAEPADDLTALDYDEDAITDVDYDPDPY